MEMTLSRQREKNNFKNMLTVDMRRMFGTRFFYLMLLITAALPILVLVMTSMNADPAAGSDMFTNVWQAFGSVGGQGMSMDMSITSMCNINMVYFLAAVLVCCFVSADFKSGYAKNIFSVRPGRGDYILSKIVVGFIACVLLIVGYTAGALIGGAVSSLPFTMDGFTAGNLVLCLISKALLMAVFVGVYVLMSVIAKDKTWLSILLSFGVGMFLFTIIPMMTPLDSGMMNVLLCLAGGVLFAGGLGFAGRLVLRRSDLV